MRQRDPAFWIRTALWLASIVIVAIPVRSLKQTHGSLMYFTVSLVVIASFFLLGLYITHKANQRQRP